MQSFNCPRCDGLNQPGAQFCQGCGIRLMQQTAQKPADQKKANIVFHIALWLSIAAIITILYSVRNKSDSMRSSVSSPPPAPKVEPKITAAIKFTGTQFVITNKDSYDWTNVKMEINGGIFSGGYELKAPVIKSSETYTVGALQFADSEGKRFNPFQMKPKRFSICGDTRYGLACYVGGWD